MNQINRAIALILLLLSVQSCAIQRHDNPQKAYDNPNYEKAVYEWGQYVGSPGAVMISAPIIATMNHLGRLFIPGKTVQFIRYKDIGLAMSAASSNNKNKPYTQWKSERQMLESQ